MISAVPGPPSLDPLLLAVLDLEAASRSLDVPKARAVRERLGLTTARYHQLLDRALDEPGALAHRPTLVLRLRRLREERRRLRSARRLGSEPQRG
jgi:hypothetical protein